MDTGGTLYRQGQRDGSRTTALTICFENALAGQFANGFSSPSPRAAGPHVTDLDVAVACIARPAEGILPDEKDA